MSARIACLVVPLFPLAARLRSEPELAGEALALFQGNGNAARLVAATRPARRAGLKPGLTLPQARALLPKLVARPRDPECEHAAQEALLDAAETVSPRVEDAGDGTIYADLEGLERRFAGDSFAHQAGQALVEAAAAAGLPARAGVASSKLAARIAAGRHNARSEAAVVVPEGDEEEFLAALPVARLSPELELARALDRWGIRSIGELARLPAAEVASRLGRRGQELHATARGIDPRPLVPRRRPPVFREGMSLEWPLVALEPFLFIARSACERLCRRLAAQGLAARRLELALTLEPDGIYERAIELPAPSRDVKTLLTLLRLELEARPPGAPVAGFRLTTHPDRPREAQLTLFGPAALSPDRLAATLARLFALLGPGRVGAPATVDGHRPERFALVGYQPPPPPETERPPKRGRGLLAVRVLRPPVPLEVITAGTPGTGTPDAVATDDGNEARTPDRGASKAGDETGGTDGNGSGGRNRSGGTRSARTPYGIPAEAGAFGPPAELVALRLLSVASKAGGDEDGDRRPRISGRVRVASGPWGLEEEWWSDDPTERDYWDVELAGGALYRIYRRRGDGEWFADGVYD